MVSIPSKSGPESGSLDAPKHTKEKEKELRRRKQNCLLRNRQRWLASASSTLSGSASWDVRAHRLSTRAWRTTSSGHILNKSSPFAKVVTHLLLIVNLTFLRTGSALARSWRAKLELRRGPVQMSARLAQAATQQSPQCDERWVLGYIKILPNTTKYDIWGNTYPTFGGNRTHPHTRVWQKGPLGGVSRVRFWAHLSSESGGGSELTPSPPGQFGLV